MKKIFIFILLIFIWVSAHCEKVAVFPELQKPEANMAVADNKIYIIENFEVYIYSLKDYKLIKKFGKKGEGPKEFAGFMVLTFYKDKLVINSTGKVSFYTKDGEFIREQRSAAMGAAVFYPLGNGFAGRGFTRENDINYMTITLYDSKLKSLKTLYKVEAPFSGSGKVKILHRTMFYITDNDRLYAVGKKGFIADVLDKDGKHIFSVKESDYKKVKFTKEFENSLKETIKKTQPRQWAFLKNNMDFPDYFPEIMSLFISNKKIYIATWEMNDGKIMFYIYDLKGKFLKKKLITFKFESPIKPFPTGIYNDKLYQLIESDDEEWELHVTSL